jgi:hypothetical protein
VWVVALPFAWPIPTSCALLAAPQFLLPKVVVRDQYGFVRDDEYIAKEKEFGRQVSAPLALARGGSVSLPHSCKRGAGTRRDHTKLMTLYSVP